MNVPPTFWRVFEKRGASITEETTREHALQLLSGGRAPGPAAYRRLDELEGGALIESRFACGYHLVLARNCELSTVNCERGPEAATP